MKDCFRSKSKDSSKNDDKEGKCFRKLGECFLRAWGLSIQWLPIAEEAFIAARISADFLPTQHVFHHIYIFSFIGRLLYILIYQQTFSIFTCIGRLFTNSTRISSHYILLHLSTHIYIFIFIGRLFTLWLSQIAVILKFLFLSKNQSNIILLHFPWQELRNRRRRVGEIFWFLRAMISVNRAIPTLYRRAD